MSLVTKVTVGTNSVNAGGTSAGQVDLTGQGILTLQVGAASIDSLGLSLPGGANKVGCDMDDPAPTAGSVQEKLIYLNGYARALRFTSPNQVTYSIDSDSAIVLGLPQDVGPTSNPTFYDVTMHKASLQHIKGINPQTGGPRVTAWGTGSGSNSTPTGVSIGGHDILIKLSFTTSASPAAAQTIAQVAFAEAFDTVAPTVIPLPGNAQTRALMATVGCPVVSTTTTGGFGFSAVTALAANTAYVFYFLVIGGP
jgi:hypothetical protein